MSDMPPAMMNFKEGGDVKERRTYGLENAAEMLRQQGRKGDTILAHINPEEAGILQLLGGAGTINPYTGLPEFFVKKVVKGVGKVLKSTADNLGRAANSIAETLGPVGQIAAAYFGGPIGAAVYAGFAAPGQKFDAKRAATAAALTYGAGQISQGMGGEATGGVGNAAGTGGPYDISDAGSLGDLGYSASSGSIPTDTGAAIYGTSTPPSLTPPSPSVVDAVGPSGGGLSSAEMEALRSGPSYGSGNAPILQSATPELTGNVAASTPPTIASGVGSLAGEIGSTALKAITPTSALDALKIASTGATAYGSIKSLQELEDQKKEAERILREQERAKAEDVAWAQGVLRDYPINYRRLTAEDVRAQQGMAGGGLAGLNAFKSGGEPRFLKGGGDGMSDDIPATIGGRQKAALSDGEFVIPADVVSHLGNGSSRAGAKKLYSMMDNIRKARTGKKRQAPEVRADRYMPA